MNSDEEDDDWVMYADRPDWADVKPTPQDDGPHPVVRIAYTDTFRDVFDYFRAVLQSNEVSERALLLTEDCAKLNPANYTVWHYRRRLLKELNYDLGLELTYVGFMIREHLKTYQLWHHRRVIVEWLKDASCELEFTEDILEVDAKNYHAWQHRQWSIMTFDLWDNELKFVDGLLERDVRNNSAWNQRHFVVNNTKKYADDVLSKEVEYTLTCIKKAVHNESAWNYLSGILFYKDVVIYPGIEEFTTELYDSGERSYHLLAFIVDCLENRLESKCNDREAVLKKALDLCDSLTMEHDKIRAEYWKYVARCLADKYGIASTEEED